MTCYAAKQFLVRTLRISQETLPKEVTAEFPTCHLLSAEEVAMNASRFGMCCSPGTASCAELAERDLHRDLFKSSLATQNQSS